MIERPTHEELVDLPNPAAVHQRCVEWVNDSNSLSERQIRKQEMFAYLYSAYPFGKPQPKDPVKVVPYSHTFSFEPVIELIHLEFPNEAS